MFLEKFTELFPYLLTIISLWITYVVLSNRARASTYKRGVRDGLTLASRQVIQVRDQTY